MTATTPTTLTHRDRTVLMAIHAGRCEVSGRAGVVLVIDGVGCCDQFVGSRLVRSGLVAAPGESAATARLTATGLALIEAA
ncbi:hypothetical protein ACVGOW_14435 [Pseudonocardia saturnea]